MPAMRRSERNGPGISNSDDGRDAVPPSSKVAGGTASPFADTAALATPEIREKSSPVTPQTTTRVERQRSDFMAGFLSGAEGIMHAIRERSRNSLPDHRSAYKNGSPTAITCASLP